MQEPVWYEMLQFVASLITSGSTSPTQCLIGAVLWLFAAATSACIVQMDYYEGLDTMVFGRLPPRCTQGVGKRRPGLASFVMLKFKQPESGGKIGATRGFPCGVITNPSTSIKLYRMDL